MESRQVFSAGLTAPATAFDGLRGADPAFRHALDIAHKAATTDCSILIIGETGTGKELVARAIHRASRRRRGPMVALNCGAIARELIASELFGHEAGAFTGANSARDGVFVQAQGGTLFLDELGELPLAQQPHLLRVLENRTVRRLGATRERDIDVRVVSATNRLAHLGTDASRLRLDLFHRVATVIVELPPLRERPDDIPTLVEAFMSDLSPTLGRHTIARATMRALMAHDWPGNVRELRQAVQRAMTLCPDELTLEYLLPPRLHAERPRSAPRMPERVPSSRVRIAPGAEAGMRPIDLIIRDALMDALDRNSSLRSAARSLGMAKSTFSDWAKRLGIVVDCGTSRSTNR